MKKKKIAVIGLKGLPAFGGAATVGENIIEQLKDKYDFTVYSTASHTNLKTGNYNSYKQIVFRKISFKKLNALFYYIASTLHVLLKENYDLIHLHHRDAAFILYLIKTKKCKVITTLHGTKLTEKWKKYRFFFEAQDRIVLKKSNVVTSVSPIFHSKELAKSKKKISYIPNGINPIDFSQFKTPKQSDLISFAAGRIVPSKGCHLFLQALQCIDFRGRVFVVGDINQMPIYRNQLIKLAKGLDVTFCGLIKEHHILLNYIYSSQLFVYPSNNEAMSMMLLEVAAVKTPIICSNIPKNKLFLNNDETLYFDTDNVDDLAGKISWALSNSEEMTKKADNAYKKLMENYSWDKISKEYSMIYDSLMAEKGN